MSRTACFTNQSVRPTPTMSDLLPLFTMPLCAGVLPSAHGQSLQSRFSYGQLRQGEHTEIYNENDVSEAGFDIHLGLPDSHRSALGERTAAGWLVLGGALGWGTGLVGGAYAGAALNEILRVQILGIGSTIGGVAGVVTMTPLRVHLMNERRGNYLLSLLGSAAVTAGTVIVMTEFANGAEPYVAAGGVALQIGLCTLIERETSR